MVATRAVPVRIDAAALFVAAVTARTARTSVAVPPPSFSVNYVSPPSPPPASALASDRNVAKKSAHVFSPAVSLINLSARLSPPHMRTPQVNTFAH